MAVAPQVEAGYGAYLPGYGIQSTGAGGIGYSLVQDTTPLSANPALALPMGARIDVSFEYDGAYSSYEINDNLLGRDARYRSTRRHFFTPQAGFAIPLTERAALGMTGFVAGMGAAYDKSPFERFGGDESSGLSLGQVGISTALAYEVVNGQALGLSLNLSYQLLDVEGIGFLGMLSEAPDKVSDQGADGAMGVGFTVGWYGELTPWLSAGAGYRSKTWSQNFDDYAGLLSQQGLLELPAIGGGGVAWSPLDGLEVAVDIQRIFYGAERALSNPLSRIRTERLGSDDGPGFGWKDQTIYKLGIRYQVNPVLCVRAGYGRGTQIIPRSETLFAALAPAPTTHHYTVGVSWETFHGWQLSGALAYAPSVERRGEDSIPAIAGGGEADVKIHLPTVGFAISRRFDALNPLDDLRSAARRAIARLRS